MLYWVYEELKYSPERNAEIFYGLAKTEDDARDSVNARTLYYLQ